MKKSCAITVVVLAGMLGLWFVIDAGGRSPAAARQGPVSGVKVPGHGQLLVSGPLAHKNMQVFFLYAGESSGDETDYMTLQEASKAGLVKISELDNASVQQLVITYTGDKPLFIIAGELISGGKQDRTMQHSLVVPPKTKNAPLPSYCVEQSRWSGGKNFAVTGTMASNRSQTALNTSGQRGVWDSVRTYKSDLRKNVSVSQGRRAEASKTSSMNEELGDDSVKKLMSGYRDAMGKAGLKLKRPLGLAYAVDGKMTALHVFHSSILFNKLRAKLMDSASVDAASGKFNKKPTALTVKDLATFIAAAWDGKKTTLKPGMDNVVTRYLASETFTSELRYKGALVHSQVGRIEKSPAIPDRNRRSSIIQPNRSTTPGRSIVPR